MGRTRSVDTRGPVDHVHYSVGFGQACPNNVPSVSKIGEENESSGFAHRYSKCMSSIFIILKFKHAHLYVAYNNK